MSRRIGRGRRLIREAPLVVFCVFISACASEQARRHDSLVAALRAAEPPPGTADERAMPAFVQASTLDRAQFVRAVLERNPSLEAARQAWRAALSRHDRETALDDPMLEYSLAPLSITSDHVPFGQTITLSQRLPWPGKLSLKGEVALAEAEAAREDFAAARLRLALMAASLFDAYYATARSLELSDAHRALVEEIARASQGQYVAGESGQQDILEAEVELAQIERDRVMLESRSAELVAQMNGLLRRDPERPLPPPPPRITPALEKVESAQALRAQAIEARPELRAVHAELRGRQSEIELAERQYYPDFGVMGSYSSMWNMTEHRWMVGVAVELPLQRAARASDVDGANAQLAEGRARLQSELDAVAVEVERARQEVIEAQRIVALYEQRLLPATRARIEVARIGYTTGRASFSSLIEAERALRTAELGHQEALAQLGQSWAGLERAVGDVPGLSDRGGAQ